MRNEAEFEVSRDDSSSEVISLFREVLETTFALEIQVDYDEDKAKVIIKDVSR